MNTQNTLLNVIFDTDAGSDCDDMMALGYLIQKQKENRISIKAVTYSHVSPNGAAVIRATFRYFGEEAPPVGIMINGNPFSDHYTKGIDERFATDEDRTPAESAVTVLRRTLATTEGKTVICAVGPLTNIAALLNSNADGFSPLNGVELVKEKCSRIVVMAGEFTPDEKGEIPAEWNVKCDITAARTVADHSPVPLAWLPFETGENMITGRPMIAKYGDSSPIGLSFKLFPWASDGRHSWDPATALYTVEGCGDHFTEHHGKVSVDENGVTSITNDPQDNNCAIFINIANNNLDESKNKVAEYLDSVVMTLHSNNARE